MSTVRFTEGEISERLGVSRTPVRQALFRLQQEGFVEVLFRSGWRVLPFDFDRFMQKLWMDRRPTVVLVTHDLRESAYLANRVCVMSARPGRILETRDVRFARPRTLESSYSPEFATLVQQLRMRIADARRDADAENNGGAATRPVSATRPERVTA